jgi:hypothetical protein
MPSSDLREILQAKIAELEEHARTLKALSETKQRFADSLKPSENRERMRQKALEHKQEALATLHAVQVLKVVLGTRTKAEQIAVMRHYVLEYGQSASRNARLSNSLADDDARKEEAEEAGLAATFVQSVLNSILTEVAPEPPGRLSTAQLSMAFRIGQVLSWAANIIALAVFALSLAIAAGSGGTIAVNTVVVVVGVVVAVVIWAVGRALRYVLAGS